MNVRIDRLNRGFGTAIMHGGELAVRAKGVLLLRESGVSEPPLDAETRRKLTELAQLERAIGKTGLLALRPLMMATGKEIWQLTLLRQ